METITFYGASDDLVEIEGNVAGCGEYDAYEDNQASFAVTATEGSGQIQGLRVHVRYERTACWSVGISPLEEGSELPDWNPRITFSGYTARLALTA